MKYFDGVDYKSVDKTLKYFKTNPVNFYQDEPIIYHVYWYGDLNRKHVCCIKSYLVKNKIATRNDNFYAWRCLKNFGIDTVDGVVRLSLTHYNTKNEVNKIIEILDKI